MKKEVLAALLAMNGTGVPPARDYMARSRRQGCAAPPSLGLHHDCARLARGGLLRRHAGNLHDQFRREGTHPLRFEPTRYCPLLPGYCKRIPSANQSDTGGSVDPTQISVNHKWTRRSSGNAAERNSFNDYECNDSCGEDSWKKLEKVPATMPAKVF